MTTIEQMKEEIKGYITDPKQFGLGLRTIAVLSKKVSGLYQSESIG